jgi:hypothetical protein
VKPTDTQRRRLLKAGALAAAVFALGMRSGFSRPQERKPRLDEKDAEAQRLGYKHDASTVDKKKFPTHKPGDVCGNCQFFQSTEGSGEWAPCSMFPGKQVNVNGWCSSYMRRT